MDFLTMLILIAIFVMVLAALGMPLSAIVSASKLPNWAKFNPANSWGQVWFDSKPWLKIILIKIAQTIIVCGLFFVNFIWTLIKTAATWFTKTLEGAAKSVIKK